jgi:hypothetical protein
LSSVKQIITSSMRDPSSYPVHLFLADKNETL